MQTGIVSLALDRYCRFRRQENPHYKTSSLTLTEDGVWILGDKYSNEQYYQKGSIQDLVYYMTSVIGGIEE